MSQLPLNTDVTVVLTDCEFFPLDSKVRFEFKPEIRKTVLFVTWLNPKAGGFKRELATEDGQVSNRFDGTFREGDVMFRVLVESIELGGRKLLIGSVQDPGARRIEAADTFVAEEEDPLDDEDQGKEPY